VPSRPSNKRKRSAIEGVRMTPAKQEVYQMFQYEKKSIKQIAQLRGCQEATVEGYLATAFECGLELDWDRLGIQDYVHDLVANAFQNFPPSSYHQGSTLRAIKDSMPQVSYGVINLVRSTLSTERPSQSQNQQPATRAAVGERKPSLPSNATQRSPTQTKSPPKPSQAVTQRNPAASHRTAPSVPQRSIASNPMSRFTSASQPTRRLPSNFQKVARTPPPLIEASQSSQSSQRPAHWQPQQSQQRISERTEDSRSWIPIKRMKSQTSVFVRHSGNSIAGSRQRDEEEEEEDQFFSSPSSIPIYDDMAEERPQTQMPPQRISLRPQEQRLRMVTPATKEFKKNEVVSNNRDREVSA
jgi:hypothetical protein